MIMGLPAMERDELLAAVAQRMTTPTSGSVSTPRELYDFQLTGRTAGSAVLEGAGVSAEMDRRNDAVPTGLEEGKMEKAKKKGKGDFDRGEKKSWDGRVVTEDGKLAQEIFLAISLSLPYHCLYPLPLSAPPLSVRAPLGAWGVSGCRLSVWYGLPSLKHDLLPPILKVRR